MKLFILLESDWILVGWGILILIGCIGVFLLIAFIENATGVRYVNRRGKGIFSNYKVGDGYRQNENQKDFNSFNSQETIKKIQENHALVNKFKIKTEPIKTEPIEKEIEIPIDVDINKRLHNMCKNYKPKS